ncbi:ankyrin [Zopfia rhizophila CBS 207.26]|uniref:Ankyrin n=1 Tax=Zopfia rhizophila CBS 207.26 TaxID=1314779 RepID=A0A6A6DZ06_9PEZI|nr:ankyrin [Zopfia rhizophila CBS 207.26]
MFKAAVKGNTRVIEWLLEQGVDPVKLTYDETLVPLHAAAYNGKLDCAKVLVEQAGMDVNSKDDIGGTPLIRAAWGGNVEMVR